jgi:hypothetical protein
VQSSEVINESLTGVFDTAVLSAFIQVISREQAPFDELLKNIYYAVEGCLSVDVKDIQISANDIDRKID